MKTILKKPKRKKVRTWCSGGMKDLGFEYSRESRKMAATPEKRKTRFVRCSICDQRFEVYNQECHDPGCIHQKVPRHKAY